MSWITSRARGVKAKQKGACLALTVVCICLVGSGFVQVPTTGRLFGTVQSDAGTPLAGVRISVSAIGPGGQSAATTQPRSTLTDDTGRFTIDQLPPGNYQLTADAGRDQVASPLFEPIQTPILIQTAKANIVNLVLSRKGSRVASTQIVDIGDEGFKLPLLSVAELQLVTEVQEPVVNPREATLGGAFEPIQITALPMRGRNYLAFLTLFPGVVDANGGEGFGSFNGLRGTAQNFTLDGTTNTDTDTALPSLFEDGAVPLDAIQEFRVITSNANAEFGRNSGGQVSLFIKRGGRALHGGVYEFFGNNVLNARDFFDLNPQFVDAKGKFVPPPFRQNQFGGNLGGPLASSPHFFFAAYEGFRNREGIPVQPRVPTREFVRQLSTNLARLDSFPSPLLLAIFLRGYPEPTRLLDADLQRRASFLGNEIGIFDTTLPLVNDTDSFLVRTDHQFGANHHLHVRYALSDGFEGIDSAGLAVTQIGRDLTATRVSIAADPARDSTFAQRSGRDFRTQNVSLVQTWVTSTQQVNEFRFGFSRNFVDFPVANTAPAIQNLANTRIEDVFCVSDVVGNNVGACQRNLGSFLQGQTFRQFYPDIGFGADNNQAAGFPFLTFAVGAFAGFGVDSLNFPQRRARNTFQFGDTHSIVHGRHSLRAGLDIRRLQQNSTSGFSLRPSFIIPDYNISSFENDFVIGGQQSFFFPRAIQSDGFISADQANGPIIRGLRSTEYGFFVQDNFKLLSNLTLDVGLRYEMFGREGEVNNLLSRPVGLMFDSDGTVAEGFNVLPLGREVGSKIRKSDLNNFGPRLGVAWDPFGDGKTAIRAAYGVYYDHIQGSTIFPSQLNPPFVFSANFPQGRLGDVPVRTRQGQITLTRRGGFPVFVIVDPVTDEELDRVPLPVNIIDPNFRDPYVQRWNLSIQRQLMRDLLIEVAYVGSKGARLPRSRTPNLGPMADLAILGERFGPDQISRLNPNFSTITLQESSASSIYHGFQLHVQRRFSRGLALQAAYTVGKSLDEVSSNVIPAGTGGSVFPQNSFDFTSERGLSAFDVRQRVAINYVYDLPFGPGQRVGADTRGAVARVLEGWSVSGILVFQSGFPLTLLAGVDVNSDGVVNDRPFLLTGHLLDELLNRRDEKTRFFTDPLLNDPDPLRRILSLCDTNPQSRCEALNFLDPFFKPAIYGQDILRPFDPNLLRRGVFTGPGRNKIDFALRKVTRLREQVGLEFRAEFFNIFNHTNLADPNVVVESPDFGLITETSTPARQIQFALKLNF